MINNTTEQNIKPSPNFSGNIEKTLVVEHIEIDRKTFTVGRKPRTTINISRKGSVVKERCQQLCEIALELFPERVVSEDDLSFMIMRYIGSDKETVRSYMGYYGHIRAGRCGDNRIVGLSRKGYLEVLGFAHKISFGRWVIHAQSVLSSQASECVQLGSNKNFSISSSGSGSSGVGSVSRENDVCSNELEEEEASEKDRNFEYINNWKSVYERKDAGELSTEEKAILEVKPTLGSSEPRDKSRVDWGACQE